MDVRIGVKDTARELSFESNQSASEIEAAVAAALGGSTSVLTLTDSKGRKFVVPAAGLAYVEIGAEESRRVGFIA
ncbi:MAG: hypothetical protein RLZZ164_853 [Actinomycetota bacterium]|jgi:hypothetical protein